MDDKMRSLIKQKCAPKFGGVGSGGGGGGDSKNMGIFADFFVFFLMEPFFLFVF